MLYQFIHWWVKTALRIFFKNINVVGTENIPPNQPVIFAVNHQNALLDALLMAVFMKQPIFFMTRADVFKKRWIANILKSLHLIPIYRIRDGYSTISQNELIFKHCFSLLSQNRHLLIFPEGSHCYQRHLRPLKKGVARMAVEATLHTNRDVLIIPVGINYESHKHSRTNVQIQVQSPISTQEHLKLVDGNSAKAINNILVDVEKSMKASIVEISQMNVYSEINDLAKVRLQGNYTFLRLKNIANELNGMTEPQLSSLILAITRYRNLFTKYKLRRPRMGTIGKPDSCSFWVITLLLLPLYFLGLIIYFPAQFASKKLIRTFKDSHWEASMKVVAIMAIYPFWTLLIQIGCWLLVPTMEIGLFGVLINIILALVLVLLKTNVSVLWFRIKLYILKKSHPIDFKELVSIEDAIQNPL